MNQETLHKTLKRRAKTFISKKVILFDLDGTLTKSKSVPDKEMTSLFCRLLEKKFVAIIGGGSYPQFKNQFLKYLKCPDVLLKKLLILPLSGGSFYTYASHAPKKWHLEYEHTLTEKEKEKVTGAFPKAFHEINYSTPSKIYGKTIEDRGSQITFSPLGQKAPLAKKEEWRAKSDIRPKLKVVLEKDLPEFEVRLGGLTSIDITKKGIDKAYGVNQVATFLSVSKKDMLYVGDALYKGGNDYVVKKTKIDTLQIKDEEETKQLIQFLLKTMLKLKYEIKKIGK